MNKFTLPPSPNWYERNVIVCAPDNTIIYGSRSDLIILHPKPLTEPADIKFLFNSHKDRVTCVNINPSWGDDEKLVVSTGDDKVIHIWDIAENKLKNTNEGHTTRSDKLIAATFCGNGRVVSVSESGFIIIWKLDTNELSSLNILSPLKNKVTALTVCPHTSWLASFGFKNGLIAVADLRRSGMILYRFKRHSTAIISLSWCPAPVNVFPKTTIKIFKKPKNKQVANVREVACVSEENVLPNGLLDNANKQGSVEELCSSLNPNCREFKPLAQGSLGEVSEDLVTEIDVMSQDATVQVDESVEVATQYGDEVANPINDLTKQSTEVDLIFQDATVQVNAVDESDKGSIQSDEEMVDFLNESTKQSTEVALIHQHTSDESVKPTSQINAEAADSLNDSAERSTDVDLISQDASVEVLTQVNAEVAKSLNNSTEGSTDVDLISQDASVEVNTVDANVIVLTQINAEVADSLIKLTEPSTENSEIVELNTQIDAQESASSTTVDVIQTSQPVKVEKEYLLASSAMSDNNIIIWRAGTDGAVQVELYMSQSKKNPNAKDYKIWIALCWATPTCLLSSNAKSELLQWNFDNVQKDQAYKSHVVHGDHHYNLFNIVTAQKIYDAVQCNNWRTDINVWTAGKDRLLLNSSLFPRCEILISYQTLSGHITCLSSSPINPTRIAMGLSDGGFRILDLSRPHLQRLVTQNFDRMALKITALAWHPSKENILACGSGDGQVCILNTYENPRDYKRNIQFCHAIITHIEWGPKDGNLNNYGLYVVINGKLILYDSDKPLASPEVVSSIGSDIYVTQIAWKPDYSMLAVGTKIGHVLIFSKDMQCLFSFYFNNKLIRCLSWHCEATEEDATVSLYSSWLAVCSNEIYVYDCSLTDPNLLNLDISKRIVCTLCDDGKPINCGVWSPHENGKLATVSDSGRALVWDVKTKTMISTYLSVSSSSFYCVLWSPLDPDYIITSNRDIKLEIWKISENPPKIINKPKKSKVVPIQLATSNDKVVDENGVENNDPLIKTLDKPKRPVRSKLILTGLATCQDSIEAPLVSDLKRLFAYFYENKTDLIEQEGIDIMKLFGCKEDVVNLLQLEQFSCAKRRSSNAAHHMSLWQGNISESMRQAISNKSLTLWHVAIAPSISHQSWREVCAAYAKQLSEDTNPNPFEIASYYLASHKIEEAIDILCDHLKFREALALAKCRLPLNSPRIQQIIEKWADSSAKSGNYEISAQCYIVLKRLEDAIMTLFRRTTLEREALELCIKMAQHSNNKLLLESAQFKLSEVLKSEADEVTLKPLLNRLDIELQKQEKEFNQSDASDVESIRNSVDEAEETVVEIPFHTNDKTDDEEEIVENSCGKTILSDSGVLSEPENLCLGDGQLTFSNVD